MIDSVTATPKHGSWNNIVQSKINTIGNFLTAIQSTEERTEGVKQSRRTQSNSKNSTDY